MHLHAQTHSGLWINPLLREMRLDYLRFNQNTKFSGKEDKFASIGK